MDSFESQFAQKLKKRIDAESERGREALANGGAIGADAATTAANYIGQVSYTRALGHVLDWAADVEDEMMGRKRK